MGQDKGEQEGGEGEREKSIREPGYYRGRDGGRERGLHYGSRARWRMGGKSRGHCVATAGMRQVSWVQGERRIKLARMPR